MASHAAGQPPTASAAQPAQPAGAVASVPLASVADYYLALFAPLLQQQAAMFQANAAQQAMYASYQASLQAAQERQRAEAREKRAAAAAAAEEAAAAAAEPPPPEPIEPIPTIDKNSRENVDLAAAIESEWRWGATLLWFEHFLPLFPARMAHLKPELLLQALMCQHHSCFDHRWDQCSCPHPACEHLASLFLQLLLLLHPHPPNTKKNPKNLLNVNNYLPLLQKEIETNFFLPNQDAVREQIQEMMSMFIEAEEAKKAHARELAEAEEAKNATPEEAAAAAAKKKKSSLKFSIPIHPPGSALLAGHLHRLPGMCKLYLLHFICEYVGGQMDEIREACAQSNTLFHAGDAEPAPPPPPTEHPESGKMQHNYFHSLGISVPHGCDDEGRQYWCFVQEDGRVHLYQDKSSGAKSEFGITMRKKGSTKNPVLRVTGNESDIEDDSDSDSDAELEPIDEAHAPPSFTFTLIAHELQAVHDFVQVGFVTQKQPASLKFLQRLNTDVLPIAMLIQKKFERLARREKSHQLAQMRNYQYQLMGETPYSSQRSTRVRKTVNYAEINEGDDETAGDIGATHATAASHADAPATKRTRRTRNSAAAAEEYQQEEGAHQPAAATPAPADMTDDPSASHTATHNSSTPTPHAHVSQPNGHSTASGSASAITSPAIAAQAKATTVPAMAATPAMSALEYQRQQALQMQYQMQMMANMYPGMYYPATAYATPTMAAVASAPPKIAPVTPLAPTPAAPVQDNGPIAPPPSTLDTSTSLQS